MRRPVAVVIGVGPGNGAAIARRFASEGYAVALVARSSQLIEAIARELGPPAHERLGGAHVAVGADAHEPDRAAEELDGDVVVAPRRPQADLDDEQGRLGATSAGGGHGTVLSGVVVRSSRGRRTPGAPA